MSAADRRALLLAAALLALAAILLRIDWSSVERGNRLFRAGAPAEAAAIYRNASEDDAADAARYNLGTALLEADRSEAISLLERSATSPDTAVAHRSSYNLGYGHLTRVEPELHPDSAMVILADAITATRTALRIAPTDQDARWNLAIAQRMLDSLTFSAQLSQRERSSGQDDTFLDEQALTRSPEGEGVAGLEPENAEQRSEMGQRTGGSIGARESWATVDPGPLTPGAAHELLGTVRDDAEQLVRGLLWAHRPDVAWWNREPYPGGDW